MEDFKQYYLDELKSMEKELKRIIAKCGMPSMLSIYEARLALIQEAKKTAPDRNRIKAKGLYQ